MTSSETLWFGYKRGGGGALRAVPPPAPGFRLPESFAGLQCSEGSQYMKGGGRERERGCNFLVCIEPEHFLF